MPGRECDAIGKHPGSQSGRARYQGARCNEKETTMTDDRMVERKIVTDVTPDPFDPA
jgi:hypothetical protein